MSVFYTLEEISLVVTESLTELVTVLLADVFSWLLVYGYLQLTLLETEVKVRDLESEALEFLWHSFEDGV